LIEINTLIRGITKMKRLNPETKTFKIFNALYQGEALTAATAAKRFGVKNLAAEASRIRQQGYAVYSTSRTAGNGVAVTEYVMGKPSREIVALGYKAKAMGITL
jgi:DNA-binding IclR family transcriptional regulator